MNNIKMVATSSYLPETRISNEFFNEKFNLSEDWIKKRTGIDYRYFAKNETITELGIKVSKKIVEENSINKDDIDGIIVTTTSTDRIMPGISFEIQKAVPSTFFICRLKAILLNNSVFPLPRQARKRTDCLFFLRCD